MRIISFIRLLTKMKNSNIVFLYIILAIGLFVVLHLFNQNIQKIEKQKAEEKILIEAEEEVNKKVAYYKELTKELIKKIEGKNKYNAIDIYQFIKKYSGIITNQWVELYYQSDQSYINKIGIKNISNDKVKEKHGIIICNSVVSAKKEIKGKLCIYEDYKSLLENESDKKIKYESNSKAVLKINDRNIGVVVSQASYISGYNIPSSVYFFSIVVLSVIFLILLIAKEIYIKSEEKIKILTLISMSKYNGYAYRKHKYLME